MENPRITKEEIALIKDAQAGNELAFNKLFEKYKNFVCCVLNQYINDEDESKDLVNIVFLKVYNKLSQFKAYDSFGGWLRIISSRTAIDYLRKASNHFNELDDEDIRLMGDSSIKSADDEVVDHNLYEEVLKEVNKFPESARKVFKLFYLTGQTVDQIAKRLNMPTGTVKSHLSRTRSRLRKINKFKN